LREALDTSIRTPAELEEIAGVPVLGSIVFDPSADRVQALVGLAAQGRRAEDFRQLRTSLDFVHTVQSVQVLAVTSAVAGEGKSSTAVNIAVMAAERGARVLLVDADLRRPRIGTYLGLESSVGLTTVLTGRVSFDKAVRTWGELKVLPSGALPPNPTELLDSVGMADLLAELRGRFDLVVLDTPPVLAVADAVVCSSIVDGTLMVYRYGRTRRAQLAGALHALRGVQARIVGTVLNARPRRGADGGYYGVYDEDGDSSGQLMDRIRSATQGPDVLRALREGLLNPPRAQKRSNQKNARGGWRPPAEPDAPKRSSGAKTPRQAKPRTTSRSTGSERRRG
jgi:capsular exopolysaccharide synthesis family protein